MRMKIVTSALLLGLSFLLAGCDRPCEQSCPRIQACLANPRLAVGECIHACKALRERLETRDEADQFKAFIACTQQLDSTHRGPRLNISPNQCRVEFQSCVRLLPPREWPALQRL